MTGIPRLPPKLPWSESADLKFSASTDEKRGQQESAEQRDHRLAQRRRSNLKQALPLTARKTVFSHFNVMFNGMW